MGAGISMDNPHSVLVYLRPARLLYVRETGPYDQSIPLAWEKLFDWLNKNGLYASLGRGFGLARDNPRSVGRGNCRYDACVEVRAGLEDRAFRELGVTTLPGGAYACRRLSGSYERMRSIVANVYSEFEPLPGLRVDERRPVVSIYVDNPNRYFDRDLRSDVCVPIIADEEAAGGAIAASA
jgi:AraC family transcriptional regulator